MGTHSAGAWGGVSGVQAWHTTRAQKRQTRAQNNKKEPPPNRHRRAVG